MPCDCFGAGGGVPLLPPPRLGSGTGKVSIGLPYTVSHSWQWTKVLISGVRLVSWALNSFCLLI